MLFIHISSKANQALGLKQTTISGKACWNILSIVKINITFTFLSPSLASCQKLEIRLFQMVTTNFLRKVDSLSTSDLPGYSNVSSGIGIYSIRILCNYFNASVH